MITEVTLPVVLAAGLVDSLNPCAFALLLVFVAATLTLVQRQTELSGGPVEPVRRALLGKGGIYIAGIFLTYLALGFGLLGVLGLAKELSQTHLVVRLVALAAIGLGLLSLQEALLPEWGIHLTSPIRHAELTAWMGRLTGPALFGAGVLVGLCTVPCSGAVYLGVLALLSAQTTLLEGAAYLLLYNVMFVLPLVLLLLAATSRPTMQRLGRWQLHHRSSLKLGLGLSAAAIGLLTLAVA